MKLDLKNFNLLTNHALNAFLLLGGLGIILYNHFAFTGGPLRFEEFLPLAPLLGSYATALKAQSAHSTKWVTPRQVILILEIASERGRDAHALCQEMFEKELAEITRRQASQLVSLLKERRTIRKEGGDGGNG
jgi:hypothetical protein